jgi:hypothetical protein
LLSGFVIKRSANKVTVRCDDATLTAIMDDAKHYAHKDGPIHQQIAKSPGQRDLWKPLLHSAERTVDIIIAYRAKGRYGAT